MRATRMQVDVAAHGLRRSHQYVTGLLSRNKISYGERSGLMERGGVMYFRNKFHFNCPKEGVEQQETERPKLEGHFRHLT
ncbi:hypothetical protein EVAR_59358_1 [Eumeta japonica]|uniref:Uncharacterized protein n=1 Tax=Eumeta variegata TaxID=151549 RepID=A0A4C2A493_EUMVA|nr:hypothetical protein EVAR_59358_1 [Eumeta japonica]